MGIKGLTLKGYMSESQRCAVLWHSTLPQSGIARMDILFTGRAAYLLDMSRLLCSVRLALHLIRSFSYLVDHNKGLVIA